MKKLIVIADYTEDTIVQQEIRSAVGGHVKDSTNLKISFVHSEPSTIHTSFLLYQVTQTEERYGIPTETVIFANTDPRIQDNAGIEKAEGAKGFIMRLASGLYVIGPNAGYCFSMIKSKVTILYTYEPLLKGSQFRSRDNYPRVLAFLMDYMQDDLEMDPVSLNEIPTFQGHFVAHIDNYGNIKTTIRSEEMKGKKQYGDIVHITINGHKRRARYVDNMFGGEVGELVLYPGSSGDSDNPLLEITAWTHFDEEEEKKSAITGKHFFKGIKPGMSVNIQ